MNLDIFLVTTIIISTSYLYKNVYIYKIENIFLIISIHRLKIYYLFLDECMNKYGNVNVWKECCKVFDLLSIAAV